MLRRAILMSPVLAMSGCNKDRGGNGTTTPDGGGATTTDGTVTTGEQKPADDDFVVQAEQFADIRVLRYRVPGFEQLPVAQKKLVWPPGRTASASIRTSCGDALSRATRRSAAC